MGQGMSEVRLLDLLVTESIIQFEQIAPGVYVASAFVARQKKVLNEFGITHVVSVMNKPINPLPVINNLDLTSIIITLILIR